MRYLLTGGGSGGHIYPLLSMANIIKKLDPDATFLFVGKKGKMEEKIVPAAGIDFKNVASTGTKGKISWQNVKAVSSMAVGYMQAKKIIKDFKPDVCIGAGGYVSVPIMMAAQKNPKIVTAVFESDQFMGRANLQLAKKSDLIFSGIFDLSERYFPANTNYYQVGFPRSEELMRNYKELITEKQIDKSVEVITFTGGSLGAQTINDEAIHFVKSLEKNSDAAIKKVILITGERYFDEYKEYAEKYPTLDVRAFENDMPSVYAETDIFVTRAGAGFLAEAATFRLPTIAVPSPNVANDHQRINAAYFADKDALIMLEEEQGAVDKMEDVLQQMIADVDQRVELSRTFQKVAPLDAVSVMYDKIMEVYKEKSEK